jgi:hypothetical protein
MSMATYDYKRGVVHVDANAISAFIVAKNECGESKQFQSERAAKAWLNQYQGHKNYNHWNVSLWLNNDEHLYSIARHMKQHYARARMHADEQRPVFIARQVLQRLKDEGLTHTPDGVEYTVTTIRAAMRGM